MDFKSAVKIVTANAAIFLVSCLYYLLTAGKEGILITTFNLFVPAASLIMLAGVNVSFVIRIKRDTGCLVKKRLERISRTEPINLAAERTKEILEKFEERYRVFLSLVNRTPGTVSSMEDFSRLGKDLYEDILSNTEKIATRLETCDEMTLSSLQTEPAQEIVSLTRKNVELINCFNQLIDEIIHLQEDSDKGDLDHLKDIVNALRSLRLEEKETQ